jgi:hypothetical protein
MPDRAYQLGDLVEDVATGETWTVDDCYPGDSRHPGRVALSRETRDGAVVTGRRPSQIRLVTPWPERQVYPGDGWSDYLMLRQAGQDVAGFCDGLTRQHGDPAAWQPAAAPRPEAAAEDVEPGI